MKYAVRIIVVKISILLSLGLFMVVSAPSAVQACSCVAPQSVEAELARSTAVFSGKVLEVNEVKKPGGYITKSVLFEVSQAWKGVTESQIIIGTGQSGGDCGFDFQQGEEYLVYANLSSMYGTEDELVSIICSRTNGIIEAASDIAILGQGEISFETIKEPNRVANLQLDDVWIPANELEVESESSNISIYVWVLVVAAVGAVGFLVWRRVKLK